MNIDPANCDSAAIAQSHMAHMVHISLTNTGSVTSSNSTSLFLAGRDGCLIVDHNRTSRTTAWFKDRFLVGPIAPRDTVDIYWWTDLPLVECEIEVVCEHTKPLKLNCTAP